MFGILNEAGGGGDMNAVVDGDGGCGDIKNGSVVVLGLKWAWLTTVGMGGATEA